MGCYGCCCCCFNFHDSLLGPTLVGAVGHEALVQFRNQLFLAAEFEHEPCNGTHGRPKGRPISIHLHGSASLAPYDGW